MNAGLDLGDDFEITKITGRDNADGTWVDGTVSGYRFQALVFADHAENEEYELADSRISKLWVQRVAGQTEVFNWDRGPDRPAADELAAAVVDFLCAGLAEHIYGN